MASFRRRVEKNFGKFPHFVLYAILEWLVIILIFIDGFVSLACKEIARLFELRVPCLLCTRIDHVLVHGNSHFYYNDSVCDNHKMYISTLAYCHVHRKLSDIRSMCKGCLLSFATEKESDFDKYKSLVGNWSVEEDRRKSKKDTLSNKKSGILRCKCCGDPMKTKASIKFTRSLSMGAPAPSPRALLLVGRNEEDGNLDLTRKLMSEVLEDGEYIAPSTDNNGKEDDLRAAAMPMLPDSEDINEDSMRTPTLTRENRFFGMPLSDSSQVSPRWANRISSRKLPADKLDFALDTNVDLNEGSDVDILARLKTQVRLDGNTLMALYMELDEERSASAIAANNAMAMITRLQAEKAAVQMEALQYQRMMEEQAEYDQEAMQVMKDILFKHEEDRKALESEIDAYREKYGQIKRIGSETCEIDDVDYQDMKSDQGILSFSEKSDAGSLSGADQREVEHMYGQSMEDGDGSLGESSFDFEKERSYLLGLLRNLEENIILDPDQRPGSPEAVVVENENEGRAAVTGNENKGVLTREVSLIRERLRVIEADSGFLKHAAMTLQRGEEGTKLLTEIAQLLRKLRHPTAISPSEDYQLEAS